MNKHGNLSKNINNMHERKNLSTFAVYFELKVIWKYNFFLFVDNCLKIIYNYYGEENANKGNKWRWIK